MLNRSKPLSAFTLIEIMLGLLILSMVVCGLGFGLYSWSAQHRLVNEKAGILESHELLINQLRKDLQAAVRINGRTGRSDFGIQRFPNEPRQSPGAPDGLRIIKIVMPELSYPAQVRNAAGTDFELELLGNSGDPQIQTLSSALLRLKWIVLKNSRTRNLVRFDPSQIQQSLDRIVIRLNRAQNPNLNLDDFPPNLRNEVNFVEVIQYERTAGGDLVREVFSPSAENLVSQGRAVIATGISSFQIDYSFTDLDGEGINLPTQTLNHPDEDYGCSVNCVQWKHLRALNLHLIHEREFVNRFHLVSNSSELGWSLAQNQLQYRAPAHQLLPPDFSYENVSTPEAAQTAGCSDNNLNSRCVPACRDFFNVTDPLSARWIGYGQGVRDAQGNSTWATASDYCKCAWNEGTQNYRYPEIGYDWFVTLERWVSPDSNAEFTMNARLNACGRQLGCNPSVRLRHPGYYLACNCLHGDSGFTSAARRELNWNNLQALFSSFPNGAPPSADDNRLNCQAYRDPWQGAGLLTSCDQAADDIRGIQGASSQAWENRCSCLTHNIDPDGKRSPTRINLNARNYEKICNMPSSANSCPQNYGTPSGASGSDAYIRPANYQDPNGIEDDDMALCECLRQNNQGDISRARDDWDFRTALGIPDASNPQATWSENQSQSVNLNFWNRDQNGIWNTQNSTGLSCNNSYCATSGGRSLGCCTTNPNLSFPGWFGSGNPQAVLPQFQGWASYCKDSCQPANSVSAARQIITGANSLPTTCGGSAPAPQFANN